MRLMTQAKNWLTRKSASTAQPVADGGVWRTIGEPYTGAWQRNDEIEVSRHDQLTFHAVFACVSLIGCDVGKLKLETKKLINGVRINTLSKWQKLLANPNQHQTTQQFLEAWVNSKTNHGNAYIFKVRDLFGDVWQLIPLNAERVKPLVDPHGNVYYQVRRDKLWNIKQDMVIPASEIIHDRFNCFFHPLVGLSPIVACSLAASQGVNIQRNSSTFFSNSSRPSGILSAPGAISETTATEIKNNWQRNYSGTGTGKTAVLGDGMKYVPISVSATDAQMVEQFKLSGEQVCTAFKVPAFKVGLGSIPQGQKVSDLNEIYYSDCLQHYIESIENLLKVSLDWEDGVEPEFNLKALIRMDSNSQIDFLTKAVGGAILSPNEARADLGYIAVEGGNSPMIQQQNYSLEAIAKRDAQANPFCSVNSNATSPKDENEPKNSAKQQFYSHYKGVFKADISYQKGDFMTKNGSLWHCDNAHQGDFDHANFTLAVKKGGANDL